MSLYWGYFTEIPNFGFIRNFPFSTLVAHIAYNFAIVVHSLWNRLYFSYSGQALLFQSVQRAFFSLLYLINRKGCHLLTTSTAMIEIVGHQLLATYLLELNRVSTLLIGGGLVSFSLCRNGILDRFGFSMPLVITCSSYFIFSHMLHPFS